MSPILEPTNDIRSISDNKHLMVYPPIIAVPEVFSKYILNNVGDRKSGHQIAQPNKIHSCFQYWPWISRRA